MNLTATQRVILIHLSSPNATTTATTKRDIYTRFPGEFAHTRTLKGLALKGLITEKKLSTGRGLIGLGTYTITSTGLAAIS